MGRVFVDTAALRRGKRPAERGASRSDLLIVFVYASRPPTELQDIVANGWQVLSRPGRGEKRHSAVDGCVVENDGRASDRCC